MEIFQRSIRVNRSPHLEQHIHIQTGRPESEPVEERNKEVPRLRFIQSREVLLEQDIHGVFSESGHVEAGVPFSRPYPLSHTRVDTAGGVVNTLRT
jgi:hypothetical protein